MHAGQLVNGRYRLEQRVGSGGNGVVWRAVDEHLDRVVALKRGLSGDSEHGPEHLALLRREASVLARFNHPHVVTLYDSVLENSELWLVMEYLPLQSLARQGTLSPGRAARIGAQLAGALAHVHSLGVVHRDVKPGNVLLTEDDRAKLADFGVSRAVEADATLTDAALFAGTPGYFAPEVATGEDPTAASDVFSLGATLFAAVEGASPFGPESEPRLLLRRAIARDVARSTRGGPLVPVLAALMHVDPKERPTAALAQRLLDEVAAEGGAGAAAGQPLPAPTSQAPADPAPAPSSLSPTAPPLAAAGSGDAPDAPDGSDAPEAPATAPDGGARPASRLRAALRAGRSPVGALVATALVCVLAMLVWRLVLPVVTDQDPTGARPGPTAPPNDLLGDLRSADPCGLADPRALARFGETEQDEYYGNFNRCDVLVDTPDGAEFDVQVTLVSPQELGMVPSGATERLGALRLVRQPVNDEVCERTFLLPDDYQIWISAELNEGDAHHTDQLCAMAEATARSASTVLAERPVPRRTEGSLPPSSLLYADACALLDADALSRFPGVDALNPETGYANWQCRWRSTTSPASLMLRFDRHPPLTAADGRPVQLGQHRAFVQPEGYGEETCQVSLVHREFLDPDAQRMVELLLVVVFGPQPPEQLCDQALELAAPAAERMPPPVR